MITKQTLKLWETLGKTIKRIEKHNAHQIDVDTAQQICRELYAELLSLEKEENTQTSEKENTKILENTNNPIKRQTEETLSEINIESKKDQIPMDAGIRPETEEESNVSDETILSKFEESKETLETVQQEIINEATPQTPPRNTEQPKSTTQRSLFETNEKSMTTNHNNNHIVGKIQSKPINDIKAAISLGDRFLFIKELFNGNADDFNQTIQQLNNQLDFDTAKTLLDNRNWDNENETVKFFYSIVQRKYLKI